jgi:hypothetical protein
MTGMVAIPCMATIQPCPENGGQFDSEPVRPWYSIAGKIFYALSMG